MSKVVAVDYGRKKIGVAVGDTQSRLSEPLSVIRFEIQDEAIKKILEIIEIENAQKLVVGISEGEMAKETRKFRNKLEKKLNIPVVFQDETLSTQKAQEISIGAHIKRKKRREMEDAFAAALILQSYLERLKLSK